MGTEPLLHVASLSVTESQSGRRLVNDVGLTLAAHGCTAIVGESGSGKTLLCKSLLGLLPPGLRAEGEVTFNGRSLLLLRESEWRDLRGSEIGLIVQDAASAFDPLYTVGNQFEETLSQRGIKNGGVRLALMREMLGKLQLRDPDAVLKKYPHQLSGGMLQRVMIALTLACEPRLIVADEPTTSLDGITQYDVIQQFIRLRTESGSAMIFVSHDLALVRELAQRVVVMKEGRVVEQGETARLFASPSHDYTRSLIETRRRLSRPLNRLLGRVADAS